MSNRLFKSVSETDTPEESLNAATQGLISFLDEHLPISWEIYANPFLNGDRPAIVLLHETFGMSIIEPFQATEVELDQLAALDDPKEGKRRLREITHAPVHLLYGVRNNIQCLYVPQFSEMIETNRNARDYTKLCLFCPNLSREKAGELFRKFKDVHVVCAVDLIPDTIAARFSTEVNTDMSGSMKPILEALRIWLFPPFHSIEQGRHVKLSERQKEHATPKSGHFRVKAVAGSGKTLVLAYRAAALASTGKRVLIVTYNKTLWHYIRAQVNRMPFNFYWDKIVFKHFHGFCRDEYRRIGIPWPDDSEVKISKKEMEQINNAPPEKKETLRRDLVSEKKFVDLIPSRLFETLANRKSLRNRLVFDAILIDEGQDYCWEWYNLLSQYVNEAGELVLVCDKKQNIYSRDSAWTDGGMRNVKFRGAWRTLPNLSYRLNQGIVSELNRFGNQYLALPDEEMIEPNPNFELFSEPELLYANASNSSEMQTKVLRAYDYLFHKWTHPSDIVIQVFDHRTGKDLVQLFESKNILVNHIFGDFKELFWLGDGRLKISTIHSFKGWELKSIILIVPPESHHLNQNGRMEFLIYTALSRSLNDICVINCARKFDNFFTDWKTLV